MMDSKSPYNITEKAADYLAKIVETVMRLEFGTDFKRDIKLHRENRVRTIYSSLAIEGNTFSLDEVTAVIAGKVVAGKQTEIREVKNADEAYDRIMTFNPYTVKDFLKAHKLMTDGLVKEAGRFRSGDVGVFDGDRAVHVGAQPQFVPQLMADLFGWAKASELHPCLKSTILHYEIETIHPFADGNGRMGRLWQTLLLARWNPLFAWIPMESVIYQNRPEYYDALYYGQHTNDSSRFIEFALSSILTSLKKIYEDVGETIQAAGQKSINFDDGLKVDLNGDLDGDTNQEERTKAILALCTVPRTRDEIQQHIEIANRGYFRITFLKPLLESGKLKMTIPDKPNSRNQKYVKA